MSQAPKTPDVGDGASSEDDEKHWKEWKALTIEAYGRCHAVLEAERGRHPGLTPHAVSDRAGQASGTFAWWWGASGEIGETINTMNAWGSRLHEWAAWNDVVESYENENDRWELLHHFVEPIAFFCMLQPSSFADRLALTSEFLLHQANQRLSPKEPDRLDQDAHPGKPMRRSDRRKQIGRLGKRWQQFKPFQQALQALDGADYRYLTRDFRNLFSHSFSPRLMLGFVQRATRSFGPLQEMLLQPDGTILEVDHPTKRAVTYAMNSLEPLALDKAHEANLAEYQRARSAIECFIALVDEMCGQMGQKPANPKP